MNQFNKNYFIGKNSNYKLGYKVTNNKLYWRSKIKNILTLKKTGTLLDIGCAYGYFLKYAKKYFKVKGIDISEHAIKEAEKILGKNIVSIHDLNNKLPFKNESFDIVTAFDVIEHVKNQEKALNEIKRILKKKGYLLIQMPILYNNKLVKILAGDTDKTHNNLLTYNKVHELIKKTGFKVIKEKNRTAIIYAGLFKIPSKKPRNYIELILQK